MKFLNPQWLWALLVLVPVYFIAVADERSRARKFGEFAASAVWRAIAPEIDPRARLRKATVWCAAMAFALLAMARPQWGSHEETVTVNGLDIMIALDVSSSMDTEDMVPSRLKKARHLVKTLLDRLGGDRVGLVPFAASSYVACPLTTDLNYVLETISYLGPKVVTNQGTDIGLGLDTARKAIDRGAEENMTLKGGTPAPDQPADTASHVVILISDGEDHEEKAHEAAAKLKEAGIKFFVLGVGTQKGGPIPIRDDAGNLAGYKKDRSGQPVVSTFKPDELMALASAGGGRYWNASADEAEIDDILRDMGALSRSDFGERRFLVYEDRFQYPLAVAVMLLLLELTMPARRLKKSSPTLGGEATPAPAALLVLLAFAAVLAPRQALAAGGIFGRQPPVGAYLDNRKGVESFKDGKVDEAKKQFGAAQARDPSLPELQFNQGVVQMNQGDVDSAIQAFGGAAKSALGLGEKGEANTDPGVAAKSFFNLGGALTKKGDIKGAIRSYLGAIDQAQRSGDPQLEADSRKNLQLLIQKKQQQQQQQQQQEQQQKQQQQQQQQEQDKKQQQQKDEQDGKQDGKQAKNEEKQKSFKQNQKQKEFRSLKLSKEDAERVMAELSNKERDLQAKLKKQHGTPQNNAKDW